MIEYPDTVLPAESRAEAYAALLARLASTEPEALARAAVSLEDEGTRSPGEAPPATTLARAWLAFSGHLEPITPPEGAKVYSFAYPAQVGFDVVSTAGRQDATRRANKAVGTLLALDQPLCAVQGPLPEEPTILNLEIWLGTVAEKNDELTIEGRDP